MAQINSTTAHRHTQFNQMKYKKEKYQHAKLQEKKKR